MVLATGLSNRISNNTANERSVNLGFLICILPFPTTMSLPRFEET